MEQHLKQECHSIATFAQDMLALPSNFCHAFLKREKVISQNNEEFSFGHSVLPF